MSNISPPPSVPLPLARDEYNAGHMNQLIRQISQALGRILQPEVAKAGGQYYTLGSLPVTGNGQRPGIVYRDGDILKITLDNQSYAPEMLMVLSLGAVTVTTS